MKKINLLIASVVALLVFASCGAGSNDNVYTKKAAVYKAAIKKLNAASDAVALNDVLRINVADLLPNGKILRGRAVPHFSLVARFIFGNAGFILHARGDAIGHAAVGQKQVEALFHHVIKAQVAEAEIIAELAILTDINDVLKHGVDTNGVDRLVL